MSHLIELTERYPRLFTENSTIQDVEKICLKILNGNGDTFLYDTSLIVFQKECDNTVKGWLYFDGFKKSTITAMKIAVNKRRRDGISIITSTLDKRIANILVNLGFEVVGLKDNEYHLKMEA
ncbi:hypothetical protein [Caudoviricetes sp.]|nr:hypothetical protein [Caudoviricetes sp.]